MCEHCNGLGGVPLVGGALEICPACLGTGELGMYFTPREIVEFVESLGGIDPACGSGGFLGELPRTISVSTPHPEDEPHRILIEG